MEKYYMNQFTGEITTVHKEAVEWYRNGCGVEIWRDGKKALIWEAEGGIIFCENRDDGVYDLGY